MRLEEKLCCLRKQRGMSQLELAEELTVSRQAISKWECGAAYPATENLIQLGRLYGVPLEALTDDTMSIEQVLDAGKQAEAATEQKKQNASRFRKIIAAVAIAAILFGILIGEFLSALAMKKPEGTPIKDLEKELIEIDDMFDMGP